MAGQSTVDGLTRREYIGACAVVNPVAAVEPDPPPGQY